ncbi:MAG: DUF5069 domain-containing protein [Akkermansiaceae bacterium]|nr:DUF5069 domain-containing protein [Akkermansiaceae bacterium]
MNTAKDLSKESPTSPRIRVGGYAILARAADKGRADLAGTCGGYHFDCPLDNFLFGFKGVSGNDVKKLLETGSSNEEIAAWLDANGTPKRKQRKKNGPTPAKRPVHTTIQTKKIGSSEFVQRPEWTPRLARFSIT